MESIRSTEWSSSPQEVAFDNWESEVRTAPHFQSSNTVDQVYRSQQADWASQRYQLGLLRHRCDDLLDDQDGPINPLLGDPPLEVQTWRGQLDIHSKVRRNKTESTAGKPKFEVGEQATGSQID